MNLLSYKTKGLYLGKPEAEAESSVNSNNFVDFFEDFLDIETNIRRGAFIISGRKGAGKSAYAMWLQSRSCEKNLMWSTIVKRNEFDVEGLIHALPNDKIKYEAFFEWVILVRLVKLLVESKRGMYTKQVQALNDFMKRNSGYVDIDKYTISEIVENKEVNYAPLNGQFGFFSRLFGYKRTKAPFHQMISPLRDTIQQVLSMDVFHDSTFYVMFDDLDVKFKLSNNSDKTMLMDLIRIARRYNTEYLSHTNARILLFVRDDISDRLEGVDCDKNKIFGSYEYRINWFEYSDNVYAERHSLLRQFINKRIRYAFKEKGWKFNDSDPWLSFVKENENDQKTEFKYILDHTFYLPRDIISIFSKIDQKNFTLPLRQEDIAVLLKEYSVVKKKEIVDELVALFDKKEIDEIFNILETISNERDVGYGRIIDLLKENCLDSSVFEDLIDYNLLIPVDMRGHLYFTYREKVPSRDYAGYTFRTHKILNVYFKSR